MQAGTNRGNAASINVTPLIDVLLVLLIIFMVIQPVLGHGLPSLLPQRSSGGGYALVLSVGVDHGALRYGLNGRNLAPEELAGELRAVLERNADAPLFIQGDADLDYQAIAKVINTAQTAGATSVALLSDRAART